MSGASPFRSLLKGSAVVFAGNIAIYVIGFVYHIFAVRALGAEKYGVWGLAYTIATLPAQLSYAGLLFGVMKYLTRPNLSAGERNSILKASALAYLASAAAATLLLCLFNAAAVERLYAFPGLKPVVYIMALSVPFVSLLSLIEAVFRAHENAATLYKVKIVPELFKLLAIPALLILSGGSLPLMAALTLAACVIPVLHGGAELGRLLGPLREVWRAENARSLAKGILLFSLPFMLNDYVYIFKEQADMLVAGHFLSGSLIGLYRVSKTLASVMLFLPTALTYLLLPILSRLHAEGKHAESEAISERTIKYMVYASVPMALFFTVFPEELLRFLYGSQFGPGAKSLQLLCLSSWLVALYAVASNILLVHARTRQILLIHLAGIVVNVGANLALIPLYAATGAAMAYFASSALTAVLFLGMSASVTGRIVFPSRTLWLLAYAGAVSAACLLTRGRGLVADAAIYASVLAATAASGWVFEREELLKGLAWLRQKFAAGGAA